MTTDKPKAPGASPIHARGEVKDAFHGRAILEAFYSMQPSLSSIARSITGNESMSVQPTAGGTYTDGKTIYMMLSPTMLIDSEHQRMLCGKRNANGLMMCPACERYEAVVVPLYHEMGHIIFGSFAEVDDTWANKFFRDEVVKDNRFNLPDFRLKVIEKRLARTGWKSYMDLAPLISPFLPMLLNALEDSRVNAGVIRANPGARKMFRADIAKVMDGGIEKADGTVERWSERPLNAQFIIAALLAASDIAIDKHWLDDEVIEAMGDPELAGLLTEVASSPSVKEVFTLSVPILERARALGFLRHEDDEELPPSPDSGHDEGTPDTSEEEGESDDSDATGTSTSGMEDDENDDPDNEGDDDAEGTSDEASDDEGEGEEEEQGSSGGPDSEDEGEDDDDEAEGSDGERDDSGVGDEPDPDGSAKRDSVDSEGGDDEERSDEYGDRGTPDEVADDFDAFNPHEDPIDPSDKNEELDKTLKQRTFEGPSRNVSGLDLRDSSHEYISDILMTRPDESVVADPQIIQRGLGPLRAAFSENKLSSFDRNKKSGKVNPRVLAKRVPFNDPRLFRKKRVPGERDYHVVIGLDISGSTSYGPGGYYDHSRVTYLQMIKTCALLQAEMLSRVGVPFEVYAHTGGLYSRDEHGHYEYEAGTRLNITELKSLREPFNDEVRDRIRRLKSVAANLDGHTLEFYRQRLDETAATDKLIIYYTDGAMPAENYEEELEILKRECNTIRRKRYDVLAVGIGNDDPKKYGLDTVRVDVPQDMQKVVTELERRLE